MAIYRPARSNRTLVNTAGGGWIFTFFTALLGSVILLWLVGMVKKT